MPKKVEIPNNNHFFQLQLAIDNCRVEEDWTKIKQLLPSYQDVFDLGAEVSTLRCKTLKEMKAYYWIVMSEVSFHHTRDLNTCIEHFRRAIAFDSSNKEIRILGARYLLNYLFEDHHSNHMQRRPSDHMLEKDEFSMKSILGNLFESLNHETQNILDSIIDVELYHTFCNSIIGSFTAAELFNACQRFEVYDKSKYSTPLEILHLFIDFIVYSLLDPSQISSLHSQFENNELTNYQVWLYMDGELTRSFLLEKYFSYQDANNSIQSMLNQYNHQLISNLPSVCRSQIYYCTVKSIDISLQSQLLDHNYNNLDIEKLFEGHFFENQSWLNILPVNILTRIVLHVVYQSLLTLHRQWDQKMVEKNIIQEKMTFYLQIMKHMFEMLQNEPISREARKSIEESIVLHSPLRNSILKLLYQKPMDNPLNLLSSYPLGLYGILLSGFQLFMKRNFSIKIGIWPKSESSQSNDHHHHHHRHHEKNNPNEKEEILIKQEIFSFFLWGFNLDVIPHPLSCYFLSQAYLNTNNIIQGISIMKQCHQSILRKMPCNEDIEEKNRFVLPIIEYYEDTFANEEFSELLKWLGLAYQVNLLPWLPLATLLEVCDYNQLDKELHSNILLLQDSFVILYGYLGGKIVHLVNNFHIQNDIETVLLNTLPYIESDDFKEVISLAKESLLDIHDMYYLDYIFEGLVLLLIQYSQIYLHIITHEVQLYQHPLTSSITEINSMTRIISQEKLLLSCRIFILLKFSMEMLLFYSNIFSSDQRKFSNETIYTFWDEILFQMVYLFYEAKEFFICKTLLIECLQINCSSSNTLLIEKNCPSISLVVSKSLKHGKHWDIIRINLIHLLSLLLPCEINRPEYSTISLAPLADEPIKMAWGITLIEKILEEEYCLSIQKFELEITKLFLKFLSQERFQMINHEVESLVTKIINFYNHLDSEPDSLISQLSGYYIFFPILSRYDTSISDKNKKLVQKKRI